MVVLSLTIFMTCEYFCELLAHLQRSEQTVLRICHEYFTSTKFYWWWVWWCFTYLLVVYKIHHTVHVSPYETPVPHSTPRKETHTIFYSRGCMVNYCIFLTDYRTIFGSLHFKAYPTNRIEQRSTR
jgi:hypothetical protein